MGEVNTTNSSLNHSRASAFSVTTAATLAVASHAASLYFVPAVRTLQDSSLAGRLTAGDIGAVVMNTVMVGFALAIYFRSNSPRLGLLMVAASLSVGLVSFTSNYAPYALLIAPESDLPLAMAAAWIQDQWMIPVLLLAALPFFFPDGSLPAKGWRFIFWPVAIVWLLAATVWSLLERPLGNAFDELSPTLPNPVGILALPPGLQAVIRTGLPILIFTLMLIIIAAGLASLIFRYQHGDSVVRQQLRWILFASSGVVLMTILALLNNALIWQVFNRYLISPLILSYGLQLSGIAIICAVGVAALRYRLYDLDLVLSRTITYTAMTTIIILGYILLVSALGMLMPENLGVFPALLATAILAVLFAPIKDRLQQSANRVVFGKRAQPFEIMQSLGARIDKTPESAEPLPGIVKTIGESMKFPYVAIYLLNEPGWRKAAEYGEPSQIIVDIPLQGRVGALGVIKVGLREGDLHISEEDKEILKQIAVWLGPLVQASSLTQELRRSHAQLVAAQAEERRRLYRDLHDDLGPSLAGHTFRLDRALELLPDQPESAARVIDELKDQTQDLVDNIRRLVYDLRSSSLDELGLLGTLRESIAAFSGSTSGLTIDLAGDSDQLDDLPAAHEIAAARIALEALNNVVQHAHASHCRMELKVKSGSERFLEVVIEDNGRGLSQSAVPGIGLSSMIKRAEDLGGTLDVERGHPQGVRIIARLPLAAHRMDLG